MTQGRRKHSKSWECTCITFINKTGNSLSSKGVLCLIFVRNGGGTYSHVPPSSYVYDMTQCKDGVTCADMLILRMLNTLGSSFSRAVWATEVFPVPTGPVRSTGRFALINVDTKKSYRNVSTVGTTIL